MRSVFKWFREMIAFLNFYRLDTCTLFPLSICRLWLPNILDTCTDLYALPLSIYCFLLHEVIEETGGDKTTGRWEEI